MAWMGQFARVSWMSRCDSEKPAVMSVWWRLTKDWILPRSMRLMEF